MHSILKMLISLKGCIAAISAKQVNIFLWNNKKERNTFIGQKNLQGKSMKYEPVSNMEFCQFGFLDGQTEICSVIDET